ncbi:hypothetical protein HKD37_04G009629 [Glycine soja]
MKFSNLLSKGNAEKDSKNHGESHPQPQHNQHLLQSKTKNMPQSLQVKNVTEWKVRQADLELGYLKSAFPDYAKQSLRDAYLANSSDLDYSIDLLHHFDDDEAKFFISRFNLGFVNYKFCAFMQYFLFSLC